MPKRPGKTVTTFSGYFRRDTQWSIPLLRFARSSEVVFETLPHYRFIALFDAPLRVFAAVELRVGDDKVVRRKVT